MAVSHAQDTIIQDESTRPESVSKAECNSASTGRREDHTHTIAPKKKKKKAIFLYLQCYNFPSSKSMSIKMLEIDGSTYSEVER